MSEPTNSNTFVNEDPTANTDVDRDVDDDLATNDSSVGLSGNSDVKDEPERVDLGNHEADVVDEPPHVNDEGHLVDKDGNKVFTTTEEAIKDGSFVLDAKGRMPGLYLDDLEALQRRTQSEAIEKAFNAASEGRNSVVERQVNVANSGIPPVTVVTKQEHPVSGDAKADDAEVPLLEKNPLPAE